MLTAAAVLGFFVGCVFFFFGKTVNEVFGFV